MIVCVSK